MESTTIRPAEVDYYNRLADQWWDQTGPFRPLHELNQLRVSWIVDQLRARGRTSDDSDRPLTGLRVLDVGCGGGILSVALARLGADVHGIDVAERNIAVAQTHATRLGLPIRYEHTPVETLAASGARYDVVFSMEVVEHVDDLPVFMQASCELVADDGLMFVATINRNPIAWLTAIVGAEYILRWLPRGTHHYALLRKPSEVAALMSEHGVEPRSWSGVSVNPLTRNFKLTPSLLVNYMLVATKNQRLQIS
ncbi:MAG: bifunctional 2-polyprenyl-6-hydroxyphenol methylase/3-demethylubiquinol 3-O-methyltransferase UbiG [Pseudomonadota bacterium]